MMYSNLSKKLILAGILFTSAIANAASTAEACQWRGKMLGAIALERDKGTVQNKVVNDVYKSFNKISKNAVKRNTINEYTSLVYSNREISADQFVTFGEFSCRKEFGL